MHTELDEDGLTVLCFDGLQPPLDRVYLGRCLRQALDCLSEGSTEQADGLFLAEGAGATQLTQGDFHPIEVVPDGISEGHGGSLASLSQPRPSPN